MQDGEFVREGLAGRQAALPAFFFFLFFAFEKTGQHFYSRK
jgi:hypothetical protein